MSECAWIFLQYRQVMLSITDQLVMTKAPDVFDSELTVDYQAYTICH